MWGAAGLLQASGCFVRGERTCRASDELCASDRGESSASGSNPDDPEPDLLKGESCGGVKRGAAAARLRACVARARRTCVPTGEFLLMPWGRREFSWFRSDSEEFLGCFFSFAGSPKHRLWAPGRRDCPLAVAIGGWVAPLWSLAHAVIRGLRLVVARCAASLPEKLLS